jgi:hypothetical protein
MKFHRISRDPSLLPDSPGAKAALPTWLIEFDGESCRLPDLLGLQYLHDILGGDNIAATMNGPASWGGDGIVEHEGAMTDGQLSHAIAEMQDRARAAWNAGDRATYDRLQVEMVGIRKYRQQTIGLFGKPRELVTDASKKVKAISSAIDRAITAIRNKQCPSAAAYFEEHVKRNDDGSWMSWTFTGTEKWQLEPELDKAELTAVLNELRTLEDQNLDEAEIRPDDAEAKPSRRQYFFTDHEGGGTFQYDSRCIEPEVELRQVRIAGALRTKQMTKANIARVARKLAPSDPWWFPKHKPPKP